MEGIKMFAEAPYERIKEVYVSSSLWRQMEESCGGHKAAPVHALVWEKLCACMERGIYVEQVSDEDANLAIGQLVFKLEEDLREMGEIMKVIDERHILYRTRAVQRA